MQQAIRKCLQDVADLCHSSHRKLNKINTAEEGSSPYPHISPTRPRLRETNIKRRSNRDSVAFIKTFMSVSYQQETL